MKKLLALLFALSIALTFTACASSTPAASDDNASIPSSNGSDEHIHSYTETVTKAAACNEDGVKAFTCTCGDSYTKAIAATGHTWSGWEMEAHAFVGQVGSEKRSCSACGASETQERTANAIANSFYDGGLQYILGNGYGNLRNTSLLDYACHEFHEYLHRPVAAETIFAALSERFEVTDALKAEMIEKAKSMVQFGGGSYGYNETDNTFELQYNAEMGNLNLLGYVHNNGNKYTVYYSYSPFDIDATVNFEVELEFNKLEGKPNRYLSAQRANSIPEDMIECPADERSEFIG